ncbi:MAG: sigma 54-interacting transcriptional regulator [Thermodesulfovibrionia bacterium]
MTQRLDIRCKSDLPVNVIYGNGGGAANEKNAKFSVMSLNGAHIDYKAPQPDKKIVGLRYELPKHGEFEMMGEIIRRDDTGMVVKFCHVNRDTKIKLWDYIKEKIVYESTCPYCGRVSVRRELKCSECGWYLNFNSPDYLIQHEKESFVNRLAAKSRALSLEDIHRILNFIDVEILGIGKCLEINQEFVGSSRAILDIFSVIRQIANSNIDVLITGESGTGKELTSKAIHERSSRRSGPFITVNCAAIPENLIETELFGHDIETVSGMQSSKAGKLELADGGTIFMDEICMLSPDIQSKLLQFLEEKKITRVGAKSGKSVDVRLIASTSKSLRSAVNAGTFRNDLYDKLASFKINLPPVRERGEDKVILARYFLNKFSNEMNLNKTFTQEAVNAIRNYNWPGNIREIINKIRRAVVMSPDTAVTVTDLDLDIPTAADLASILSLRDVRSTVEKKKLIEALNICRNNISKTAKVLGISRPSVYSLKKKFGI